MAERICDQNYKTEVFLFVFFVLSFIGKVFKSIYQNDINIFNIYYLL